MRWKEENKPEKEEEKRQKEMNNSVNHKAEDSMEERINKVKMEKVKNWEELELPIMQ